MNPKALQLQERTRTFASRIIRFCDSLPKGSAAQQIAEQLRDAANSVDSNYRAACRARSPDEFIAKIGLAVEESDESKGWLELLVQAGLMKIEASRDLIQEANELVSIFVASRKTAERRKELREQLRKQIQAAKRSRPRK